MKLVPNWVILVVTVAVFTIAFGGTYALGRSAGVQKTELKYSKQTIVSLEDAAKREREIRAELQVERDRLRDVSGKLQAALANKEVVYEDNVRYITKEIEKPVYQQCFVPASGVQLASANAERLNATRRSKD